MCTSHILCERSNVPPPIKKKNSWVSVFRDTSKCWAPSASPGGYRFELHWQRAWCFSTGTLEGASSPSSMSVDTTLEHPEACRTWHMCTCSHLSVTAAYPGYPQTTELTLGSYGIWKLLSLSCFAPLQPGPWASTMASPWEEPITVSQLCFHLTLSKIRATLQAQPLCCCPLLARNLWRAVNSSAAFFQIRCAYFERISTPVWVIFSLILRWHLFPHRLLYSSLSCWFWKRQVLLPGCLAGPKQSQHL